MERIALGKKKLVSNDRRRRRGKVHELELIFEPCEHTKIIQKVHKTSNSISLSPSLGLSVQKLRFLFRSSSGQAMALIHFVGEKKKARNRALEKKLFRQQKRRESQCL